MLRRIDYLLILGMSLSVTITALTETRAVAGSRSHRRCRIDKHPAQVGETYVVSVRGLPTHKAINLMITDPNGDTLASPLGITPHGVFKLNESSSMPGRTTYTFSGPFKKHTVIYASCSVVVS